MRQQAAQKQGGCGYCRRDNHKAADEREVITVAAGEMVADDKRYMMNAAEVAAALGVKTCMAYKLIREWNQELKAMGKLTIRGKINRKYFESKLEV